MSYQIFQPNLDLESFVDRDCTLEVPGENDAERQRIVSDGRIEMVFILEEEFILQPRTMVFGRTVGPFYIEPTGYANT